MARSVACGALPSSIDCPRAAYAWVGSHFAMLCSQSGKVVVGSQRPPSIDRPK